MPQEMDQTFTVALPADNPYGGKWTLNLGDLTGLDEGDVYKATGFTFVGLSEKAQEDSGFGIMLIAAVVWLVRRKQFEHTTYEQIAATIKYGTEFEIITDEDDAEGKDPATAEGS